jgi:hypothetical protein
VLIAAAGDTDWLSYLGPFIPFAVVVLGVVRILWQENKAKDAEIRRLTDTAMEKILPLVLEATKVLADEAEGRINQERMVVLMEELLENIEALRKLLPRKRPAVRKTVR